MVEVTVLDSKHTQAVPSARTTTKDLYFAIHHAVGDFLDCSLKTHCPSEWAKSSLLNEQNHLRGNKITPQV